MELNKKCVLCVYKRREERERYTQVHSKQHKYFKKDGEDCNEATNNIIRKSTTINHIIKMPD